MSIPQKSMSCSLPWAKNFHNRSKFNKALAKNKFAQFFRRILPDRISNFPQQNNFVLLSFDIFPLSAVIVLIVITRPVYAVVLCGYSCSVWDRRPPLARFPGRSRHHCTLAIHLYYTCTSFVLGIIRSYNSLLCFGCSLCSSLCDCFKATSSFCCQSSAGSTILSTEFVRTSVLIGCRSGDVELATETFAWSCPHYSSFWTIT